MTSKDSFVVKHAGRPKPGGSFADRHPELVGEWHPTKNGDLTPADVKFGSARRVWWRCSKCVHDWESQVSSRSHGSGCPKCGRASSGKARSTPKPGGSFADRHLELVGEWHPTRNGDLTPADVKYASGRKVWWRCRVCGHDWEALVGGRSGGYGCPPCGSASSGKARSTPQPGDSFADRHPELVAEWHPTKNGDLTPTDVKSQSNKKVWWRCRVCGHDWEAPVSARSNGRGCLRCWLSVVKESAMPQPGDSLADRHPELVDEWHPTRNGGLTPDRVRCGSHARAWWQCRMCGHAWDADVYNRSRGDGCPSCACRVNTPMNRLSVVYPELAAQWHPTKNGVLTAADISFKFGKRVWWLCAVCGGTRLQAVAGRLEHGCPRCPRLERRRLTRSLAVQEPELAAEWHRMKNGDLTAADVLGTDTTKVWWECAACGYEWKVSVYARTRVGLCPDCGYERRDEPGFAWLDARSGFLLRDGWGLRGLPAS